MRLDSAEYSSRTWASNWEPGSIGSAPRLVAAWHRAIVEAGRIGRNIMEFEKQRTDVLAYLLNLFAEIVSHIVKKIRNFVHQGHFRRD